MQPTRRTLAVATLAWTLCAAGLPGGCSESHPASRELAEPFQRGQPIPRHDGLQDIVATGDPTPDPDFRDPGVRDDDPVYEEGPDPSRPDWLAEWLDGDADPGTAPAGDAAADVAHGAADGEADEVQMARAVQPAGQAPQAAEVVETRLPVQGPGAVDLADLDLGALIERLREPATCMAAWEALKRRDREPVVSGLAAALESWRAAEPPVGDAQRSLAYELLLHHRASASPGGFAALLAGLDDPSGEVSCVQALILAPDSRREAAVLAITERLLAPGTRATLRASAFRTLTALGALDARTRDLARRRLSNPAAPRHERSAAAEHLLRAERDPLRLAWLVELTDDEERDELVLGALDLDSRRLPDPDPLRAVKQEIVLARLGAPSAALREKAVGALLFAFGRSAVLRDEAGALVVNPALGEPLEAARERENDEAVRRAIEATQTLLQRALDQG